MLNGSLMSPDGSVDDADIKTGCSSCLRAFVRDTVLKWFCTMGVQNEDKGCPKWLSGNSKVLKFEKAGKYEKGQIQSHHEGHEGSEVKPGSAGRQTGFMDLFRSKQKQSKAGPTTGAPRDGQFKTCKTGVSRECGKRTGCPK